MKILVTGASGFIGRNLVQHLSERNDIEIIPYSHSQALTVLTKSVADADAIVHLAGVNRPTDPSEFDEGNAGFTAALCLAVNESAKSGKAPTKIIYASSIQAALDNGYGRSKRNAEVALSALEAQTGIAVHIFRLVNVFGKWCRPNYNSAVATFCHNLHHGLPLQINDANAALSLVYIDDVVANFMDVLDGKPIKRDANSYSLIEREYKTTVGEVASILTGLSQGRQEMQMEEVGQGLKRALYATFMSYMPPSKFSYSIPAHTDVRGSFSEMLKTQSSGQFSYFTAHPGVTRGGHYHHTKCEKFLVLKGAARFRFRNLQSGDEHEIFTDGKKPVVVDTVPGWTHDITNVGSEEMIVMLWASEQFDRANPDTYSKPI